MIKSVLIAAIMTGSIAMILPASAAQITIYGRIDSGVLYRIILEIPSRKTLSRSTLD